MAGEHELTTAKYFQQAEAERQAAAAAEIAQLASEESPVNAKPVWERLSTWTSVVAGGAVVTALAILVVPYVSSLSKNRPKNAIDMMLRLGGASKDQTFEQFIRDSYATQQLEWEERYKESPVYQFNTQNPNWNFDSSSLFKR